MMHVSILALHVFLILSVVKYGITKAAPPTIVKPLDNAASQTLQISRSDAYLLLHPGC